MIISRFVKEQKRYSKNVLKNLFLLNESEINKFIKELKSFGILKTVTNCQNQRCLSDLIEEDVEIEDDEYSDEKYLYVFVYVGVLTIGERVIKCIPKYIKEDESNVLNSTQHLKLILKVLQKYSKSEEQILEVINGNEEKEYFNQLALSLFLLNDYYDYGVYNNEQSIIEINGRGEINWERTINQSFGYLDENKPYYTELYTESMSDDQNDFITRLHRYVLSEISEELERTGLLDLFEIVPVNLSDENLDDFGDKEYILTEIKRKLEVDFITRNQILLKSLYMYIMQSGLSSKDSYNISLYGTSCFYTVWEKVCSKVFGNILNEPLKKDIKKRYKNCNTLLDIIEKPRWFNEDYERHSKKTLIPDIVSIEDSINEKSFIIMDAKYYNFSFEKNKPLEGYPGIQDVTKQYLYQLSLNQFIKKENFNVVKNVFLMPSDEEQFINKGYVELKMLSNLDLENIQICMLPTSIIYKKYLNNDKVSVAFLNLK